MSNSIFIKISDEYYLKSDNNCIMVCIDKGDTKFPGGLIAKYYKPLTWHITIFDTYDSIKKLNINPTDDYFKYIDKESKFFECICKCQEKFTNFDFLGYKFELHDNNASLCYNKKHIAYTMSFGHLFMACYNHYIRNSNVSTYSELFKILNKFTDEFDNICLSKLIYENK